MMQSASRVKMTIIIDGSMMAHFDLHKEIATNNLIDIERRFNEHFIL